MKTQLKTIAIALPMLFASSAFAHPFTDLTSSTSVRYTVTDGVATLYGTVDSRMEKRLVEKALQNLEGVNKVHSLLFVSQ